MMRRKKESGFTLIELMIVIAVIGILAIVLIPKVGTVKTQAKAAGIDTNIRMVQGFVESKISYWGDLSDTTTVTPHYIQANIQAEIEDAVSGTDPMVNPFGGTTAIAVTTASTTPGVINVTVPATAANLKANGIVISGLDSGGNVYKTVVIKP